MRWIVLMLFIAATAAADDRWIGEYHLGNESHPIRVRFSAGGGMLEHSDQVAPNGRPLGPAAEVRGIVRSGDELRFEAPPLAFAGRVDGGNVRGEVRRGDVRGTFSLLRMLPLDRAALERFNGLYDFGQGRFTVVRYLADIESLTYVEFPSGRIGPLLPVGDGTFVGGPSLLVPYPVRVRVGIGGDALTWQENDTTRRARRVRFAEEEVTFRNGEVRLAGTLTLPAGRGPHPAVVLLHGGGPQTRDFHWVAPFFARHGVAVLAYDKRGVGGSSGDWRPATSADLAGDGLAAVDFLGARRDIDPKRVGFYGSSNGGWVAPVAAARAPEKVAFVIVRSASALPERENNVYEVESDLRAHGYGDEVVAKMRALYEKDAALVRSGGEGWNDFRAELARAAAEPWFPLTRLPPQIMEWNDANRAAIGSWIAEERRRWFQPAEFWRRVRQPVLMQIGAADESVPGPRSAQIIEDALRQGGNRRATVLLYPRGNHPLFDVPPEGLKGVRAFVPRYLEDLSAWIRRYIVTRASPE